LPSFRPGFFFGASTGRAVAAMVFFALSPVSLLGTAGLAYSWDGVLADSSTGKPVAGAVVVRSWHRITAMPGGGVTSFLGVEEGLSDRDGSFHVSWRFFGVSVPLMSVVEEDEAIVFKPGYEHLSLRERPSKIELVPVPTSPSSRTKALRALQSEITSRHDKAVLLRTVMEKEEEFLNAALATVAFGLRDSSGRARTERVPTEGSLGGGRYSASAPQAHPRQQSDVRPSGRPVESLIRDLKERDWRIQAEARRALLGLAGDAVEPLLRALRDDDPEARRAAAQMLGLIEDGRAVEPLTEALKDQEPKVRNAAMRAVGRLGDPRGVRALIGLWKDPSAETRTKAAESIVESGGGAVESLILALGDEDPYVRWRSAWTMGKIGDTRSVEPLIKTLDDDAPEVRWMAVHALGEIKDMKAFEPLTALLGDRDTGIASEANRSLERLQRKEEVSGPGLRPPDLDAQRPVIQRIHPVAPQGGMK